MIGIQLEDGSFLEIPSDLAISIKLENPIFGDFDKLSPGSYSLPFNLPVGKESEFNEVKLGHPSVIENFLKLRPFASKLFISSSLNPGSILPFKDGNIKLKAIDKINNLASTYFTFGFSTISADIKTKKLREVLDEEFLVPSITHTKIIYIKKLNGSGTPATIEVMGQLFTYPGMTDFGVAIDGYFQDNNMVNYLAENVLVGNTPLGQTPAYVRLTTAGINNPLTVRIPSGQENNWTVEVGDMTAEYNNFKTFLNGYITGSYPNNKLRFPVAFNEKLFGDEAIKDSSIINGVDSSGFIVNEPNWGYLNNQPLTVKINNSIQPFVLLKYALDAIADAFNFTWTGDFYDSLSTEERLIDNSVTLDVIQDFIGTKKFAFWRSQFNINELVPDVSVLDFLKALQSRYNLAVDFNTKTRVVKVFTREPVAKSNEYKDITAISSQVKGFDNECIQGYKFLVKEEENDEFSNQESLTVGEPEEEYPITCGRLNQEKTVVIDGQNVTGVYVNRKLNSSFKLRIFHYKGVASGSAFNYSQARINGTTINEDLTSIVNKFWARWISYHANRFSVKLTADFPLRELLNFDWTLKRRFDRLNYLVKSIDLTISSNQVVVENVELYTMK
jgi:hypothetical protein